MSSLPFTLPRWAWIALGGALLLLALYIALDQYGDRRFSEGKAQADAEWQEASNRLIEKAQAGATKADKAAAARAADHAAKLEDEKEKVDAALDEGSSPFDVLFDADGR
jgi:hypothetical protein